MSEVEGTTKQARPKRVFRVIAIVVTVLCGLTVGAFLSRWSSDYTANHIQTASTKALLRIVQRQDNLFRRTYRDWVVKLPAAVQKILPTPESMYPDAQKPGAIKQLALRTNESSVIVPVLVDQLTRLKPQDLLTAAYVSALASHGRSASNAIPWLEAAASNPTNTIYLGSSYEVGFGPVSLFGTYHALAAISGEPHQIFIRVTNQLSTLCFSTVGNATNSAPGTGRAARQGFGSHILALTDVVRLLDVPKPEKIQYLQRLFSSPSQTVRDVAWEQLRILAPRLPEVRNYAIERLNDPRNRNANYLQRLLVWARNDPQLVEQIESPIRSWLARSKGLDYWMLAGRIMSLGTNSYRFADALVDDYFKNRLTGYHDGRAAGWSDGYQFPPDFEKFLHESHADVTGLLDQLRTAALDKSNRYRFDDARVYSLLGGKAGLELDLLKDRVANAPTSDLKMMIGRYARLETNQTKVAKFLEGYFDHSNPQVRRRALLEMSRLGDAAKPYLPKIDQMIHSDKSQIVRWQAQRTANRLRGLAPDTGIREEGPVAEPQSK